MTHSKGPLAGTRTRAAAARRRGLRTWDAALPAELNGALKTFHLLLDYSLDGLK